MLKASLAVSCVLVALGSFGHAATPEPARVEGYTPTTMPAAIAPTLVKTPVEVAGEPRMTQGHPCTLWDEQDIAHYKAMLKTSQEMQKQLAELRATADKRLGEPLGVPEPQKGADGQWLFPGEYFPLLPARPDLDKNGEARYRVRFQDDAPAICYLAEVYALTGEAKYGEYAKKLLLAWTNLFEHSKARPGYHLRFGQGIFTQMLDEGIWLTQLSFGYDSIYNLPGWTAEERKQVHDGLGIMANIILYPGVPERPVENSYGTQANNRGVLTMTGVLAAGYATDDPELVQAALYGTKPTRTDSGRPERVKTYPPPREWAIGGTAEKPFGGFLGTFLSRCIGEDGMWIEGSPGYAMYAGCGFVFSAEMAWHHGVDLYRYQNGTLKRFFDFPLLMAYPDRTFPALNDSSRSPLAGGTAPILYQYVYRRYRDPHYLPVINHGPVNAPNWIQPSESLRVNPIGAAPPAVLYDRDLNDQGQATALSDMNFASVGFGIMRTPGPKGLNNLIFCYGPSASHGHPDKLQIDLFAQGDLILPSPGINFPYNNNERIEKWYHQTVSHNTLTVDEKRQFYLGGENPRGLNPRAEQIVYGPAETVGLQRGWSNTVYAGVVLDRAVFLTPNYLADLFGAFSDASHKYDLAWHIRGNPTTDLQLTPMKFTQPTPMGYVWLSNVRHAQESGPWSVSVDHKKQSVRLVAAATPTDVILADGGFYVDFTAMDEEAHARPLALTILQRREGSKATLYGNALDLSGVKEGYVKKVVQEGGLEQGYGLLQVTTAQGTDLCFASYRPGTYKAGGLETDALQALVVREGAAVQTLYLGGGKTLKVGDVSLERSEPGLAYVEKRENGKYVVGNPSATDATVSVTLPGVAEGLKVQIKAGGQSELPMK